MSQHTKLTKPERVLISEWKKQGLCGNEFSKQDLEVIKKGLSPSVEIIKL